MTISKEDLDKIKSQRHYRPYCNQIFYDRKLEKFLITTNPFLRSETNVEIIGYRYINEGTELVMPLKTWNSILDDGKLRIIEQNQPQVWLTQRNVLQEAIELLKEIKLEISLEDLEISDKITNFLNSL